MPVPYNICNSAAGSGSTTLQVTVGAGTGSPQGTGTGDGIRVGVMLNATSVTWSGVTVTDSQGNVYALEASNNSQTPKAASYLATKSSTGGPTVALVSGTDWIKVTRSGTTGEVSLIARGCPGVLPASTTDKSNNASAANTTTGGQPSSGSTGTLSQGAEWVTGIIANSNAGGAPASPAFGTVLSVQNASNPILAVFDEVVSATTAQTASATLTSSSSAAWCALVATALLGSDAAASQTVHPSQTGAAKAIVPASASETVHPSQTGAAEVIAKAAASETVHPSQSAAAKAVTTPAAAQTVHPSQSAAGKSFKPAQAAETVGPAQSAAGIPITGSPYLIGTNSAAASLASSLTVTAGSNGGRLPAQADAILAAFGASGNTVTAAADSTGSNSYSLPSGASDSTNPSTWVYSCRRPTATPGPGATFTGTYGGTAGAKAGIVIGVPAASALDTAAAASGTSGAPSVATGTLADEGEWLIAVVTYGQGGGGTFTWDSGWTPLCSPFQAASGQEWMAAAWIRASSTAAVTAGGTMTSANWTIVVQPLIPLVAAAAQTMHPSQAAAVTPVRATRDAAAAETLHPSQTATAAETLKTSAAEVLHPSQAAAAEAIAKASASETLHPSQSAAAGQPGFGTTASQTVHPSQSAAAEPIVKAQASETLHPSQSAHAAETLKTSASQTVHPSQSAGAAETLKASASETVHPGQSAAAKPIVTAGAAETVHPSQSAHATSPLTASAAETLHPSEAAVAGTTKGAAASQAGVRPAQSAAAVPVTGKPYLIGSNGSAKGEGTLAVAVGSSGGHAPAVADTLLVAACATGNTAEGVTDSNGAADSYALPPGASNTATPGTWIYACQAPGELLLPGGGFTITYGGTAGAKGGIVIGVPGVSGLDTAVSASGSSGAPSVTTGTLAEPGEFVVAVVTYGNAGGSGFTWGAGWTVIRAPFQTATSNEWMTAAYHVASGTSPVTAGGTMTSAAWTIVALPLIPVTAAAIQQVTPGQSAHAAVTGGPQEAAASQALAPVQAAAVSITAPVHAQAAQGITPPQAAVASASGPGQFPQSIIDLQVDISLATTTDSGTAGTPGLHGAFGNETAGTSAADVEAWADAWSSNVYPIGARKVYETPQGTYPTTAGGAFQACLTLGMKPCINYLPSSSSSTSFVATDGGALVASVQALYALCEAAGLPMSISLAAEANSGNYGGGPGGSNFTAAMFREMYAWYYPLIKAACPQVSVVYNAMGYHYANIGTYFPGPTPANPGATLNCDYAALDIYCNSDYINGLRLDSNPDGSLSFIAMCDYAGVAAAIWEMGSSATAPSCPEADVVAFLGHVTDIFSGRLAAGLVNMEIMWWQGLINGPPLNIITYGSPADFRISLLQNLVAQTSSGTPVVTASAQWQGITPYIYNRTSPAVTITRGRPGESSTVTPSTASMQVSNATGNFTAENPLGEWYGQISKNTPLRVSVPSQQVSLRLEDDTTSSAWCPDASALDVTGSIDVRADVTLTSYMPCVLASKWPAWLLGLNGNGTILFSWTDSSGAAWGAVSTQPVPWLGRIMVRATLNHSTGAVTFYASPMMGGSFTQVGGAVNPAGGATSVGTTTQALTVGNYPPGQVPAAPGMTGNVHEFRLYNGIAGTLVADPMFSAQPPGATSFPDAQGNVWSLWGTAELSQRSYRFHGEMSQSPKATDPTMTDVYVPLECGGILRRLSQGNAPVWSPMRRALQAQSGDLACVALWPCEDLQGAQAIGSAVGGQLMTVAGGTGDGSVTTTGPAFAADSSFACSSSLPQFNGSSWAGRVGAYVSNGSLIVRFLMNIEDAAPAQARIMRVITSGTLTEWSLYYGTGGQIGVAGYDASGTVFDSGLFAFNVDNSPMWVSMELRPGSGSTVNWSLETLAPGAATGYGISGTFTGVIGNALVLYPNPQGLLQQSCMGHISVQSAWESLYALYQPLDAWEGETAASRFARLCGENGIAARVYGFPEASAAMGAQPVDTLPDLLQQCEDADRGMIYEPRQAYALGYYTLAGLCNQAPAVTLDWSAAQLAYDGFTAPTDDDQYTINDVTATRESGGSSGVSGASYRYFLDDGSAMSITGPPQGVGDYATSISANLQYDAQLRDLAGWAVHVGTQDGARYPAIPLDLARTQVAALFWELQGVDIGNYVAIVNPPPWLTYDDIRQLAAGATEHIGGYIWQIYWNGIPEQPYETAVYDDPVYGRADTSGSSLAQAAGAADTTLSVATAAGNRIWTTNSADFPFDIQLHPAAASGRGEQVTVTGITGTASPQAFTVVRSVNGVVTGHGAGETVSLFHTPVYALS